MKTYRLGARPTEVLAITLDSTGRVVPHRHVVDANGILTPDPTCSLRPALGLNVAEFTVRVPAGDSGVIEIGLVSKRSGLRRSFIPLGVDRPFLESDMPMSPGANGAFSQIDELPFCLRNGTLSWSAENLTGSIALSPTVSTVTVSLRLHDGSTGEIEFTTALFPDARGLQTGLRSGQGSSVAFPLPP